MKTVKRILLGVLGFLAWIQIGISGDMLQVPRKDFTAGCFIYPALLIASVVYLNWLFRVFLMPLSHLGAEQRQTLKQQAVAQYSRGFLAGTVGFGYFLLALYAFGFLANLRGQPTTPNLALPGVFFILLGTLAQVRGLVRHLSGCVLSQTGKSIEQAPSANPR